MRCSDNLGAVHGRLSKGEMTKGTGVDMSLRNSQSGDSIHSATYCTRKNRQLEGCLMTGKGER